MNLFEKTEMPPLENDSKIEETFSKTDVKDPEDVDKETRVSLIVEDIPLENNEANKLFYEIDDIPPWYLTLFLGFQHYLTMIGGTVSVPFILCPAMCMVDDDPDRAKIISTLMFASGVITLLQSTFGTRLPIVQGPTFTFVIPALAILGLPRWACPSHEITDLMTEDERRELWQVRIREIQGAMIVASLVEVFLGLFGIVGMILRFFTPMTIAPCITLIGLSLFKVAAQTSSSNWGIAIGTIFLIILFSQYLGKFEAAVPCSKSEKTGEGISFPVFQVFPVLLGIGMMWAFCGILTATGVFVEGSGARTDAKIRVIQQSLWFRIPYPFQWGIPTVTIGGVLGMLSGVISGTVESIGDYYACARISGASPPPVSSINRGIFTEGIGGVISGVWGSGSGTTSFSENIGAISITKVGSRRVIQAAACLMIIGALIGKIGAIFVTIPEPIIGGVLCVVFAIVTAVGLANLQGVDLNSPRNIFIIGFSIFFGLTISQWVHENPRAIDIGPESLNQIVQILLSTGMFVSGLLGFILDNTIAGTPKERGLIEWSRQINAAAASSASSDADSKVNLTYDFPFGMDLIRKVKWLTWVPISPTYKQHQT